MTLPGRFVAVWSIFTLCTYLSFGSGLQLLHLGWGLWAAQALFHGGLSVVGWQLSGHSARAALGGFSARSFGVGAAFGAANYFAWAVPLMALAHAVFPARLVQFFDSAKLFERHSQVDLALAVSGAVLAAPLCEELFFRGFLQRGFREAPRGIVLTALIFSACHFDPVGLLARFELGVLFGLLAWKSGSVWPAVGAHAANNGVTTLLYFLGDAGDDTPLGWKLPLLCFAAGNLALLALTRFAGEHLRSPSPSTLTPVPPRTPWAWFSPWLAWGLASFLLLLAFDWRGVALNVIDARAQPGEAVRTQTRTLRARARAGELPLSDYRQALRPPN